MKDLDRPEFNSENTMVMSYSEEIPNSERAYPVPTYQYSSMELTPNGTSRDSASEISESEISAYSVPLVPLPAILKSRLMARLGLPDFNTSPEFQRLLSEPIESLITIANTIKTWQPFSAPPGSTYAPWKVDANNRQVAFFLRAPTAGALPLHRHATGEAILVLEGDFVSNGVTYQAGERSISAARTIHQPTTQGCLVLSISSLDDEECS
jgi:hypothetical protein